MLEREILKKSKKSSVEKLDLHGVRHEDAKRQLIDFIEKLWNSGAQIEIITGHSPQMKGIVEEVFREYKLKYDNYINDEKNEEKFGSIENKNKNIKKRIGEFNFKDIEYKKSWLTKNQILLKKRIEN